MPYASLPENPMLHKHVDADRQLYVFWNGQLIYKRWLDTGVSVTIESYGPPTRGGRGRERS